MFARCLSSLKTERTEASKVLPGPSVAFTGDKKAFIEDIRQVNKHLFVYSLMYCVIVGSCFM